MDVIYFDDALNPSPTDDVRALRSAESFSEVIQEALKGRRKLLTYWDPLVMARAIDARSKAPTLVVLDILNENRTNRLDPKGNCGIELAKKIYKKWPRVPIIFLSLFEEEDPERGLAGEINSIREYVRKGHRKTESLLKQAVERLASLGPMPPTEWGRLKLDHETRIAYWRGHPMITAKTTRLTPKEYRIVERIVLVTVEKRDPALKTPVAAQVVTYDEIRNGQEMSESSIYGFMTAIREKFSQIEKDIEKEIQAAQKSSTENAQTEDDRSIQHDSIKKWLALNAIFQTESGAYRLVEPE